MAIFTLAGVASLGLQIKDSLIPKSFQNLQFMSSKIILSKYSDLIKDNLAFSHGRDKGGWRLLAKSDKTPQSEVDFRGFD
jgi:hypothetical protein